MPLEIKVGHRYRTRSGDVVEIVRNDGSESLPFIGIERSPGGFVYQWLVAPDGKVPSISGTGEEDLIEELPARCHICGDDTGKHTPDCTLFLPGISYAPA